MTDKHNTPEWRATCRVIKAQVRAAYARGEEVTCWRCGLPLPEVEDDRGRTRLVYDVGHLNAYDGSGIENAAPEHRTKAGICPGNRNLGGRAGAALTNARRTTTTTSSFRPLAWA